MSNEFWDSFNSGYGAASDARQRAALARMKRDPEGGMNALMVVNPDLAMRYREAQRQGPLMDQQNQIFARQQTQWGQEDALHAARQKAGAMWQAGDHEGAITAAYGAGDVAYGNSLWEAAHAQRQVDDTDMERKRQFAGSVAAALKKVPLAQRQGWVQRQAGYIKANGGDVWQIDPAHLDDASLDQILAWSIGPQQVLDNNSPPKGYRWDAHGNLTYIPGGPADPRTGRY